MKPNGRIHTVKFPGKIDCHPKKGYVNWWEDECCNIVKRGALKQIWKKEVELELIEIEKKEAIKMLDLYLESIDINHEILTITVEDE